MRFYKIGFEQAERFWKTGTQQKITDLINIVSIESFELLL